MITDRTAFAAGNHSVSIAAADTIGLTAQNVVPFTLGSGTRTNSEFDESVVARLCKYDNDMNTHHLVCAHHVNKREAVLVN